MGKEKEEEKKGEVNTQSYKDAIAQQGKNLKRIHR